jgi:uncharacterized OsmC-like protein
LVAEATGEVELEGQVLVIRRIHVRFTLIASESARQTAERVHGIFSEHCPVYRSLKNSIAMTTALTFKPQD